MMSKLVFVVCAVAAMASGASAAAASATFCQRYSAALFGTANSANEVSLIGAVVDRAVLGNTTGPTANGMPIPGLLASNIQRPFFTSPTNFYTNNQAAATLLAHLKSFFTVAFGCKEVTSPGTFSTSMSSVHGAMNISAVVFTDFITVLANTLRSFGVVDADITYAAALLGQFGYGAGTNQVCNFAGDCPMYTSLAQFISGTGTDGSTLAWIDQAGTDLADNSVDIGLNGYVHWDMTTVHSVVQTDAAFATMSGGFTSGAVGATTSYTRQFPTAGTYYFKCGNVNHPTMQGVIRVAQSGGDAAGLSASFGAVLAAIAAVFVARRM